MADIASTAAQVEPVVVGDAEIRTAIAAVAITKGQAVYINSAGKAALSNAGAAGTAKFRGMALETVGAGQAVSIMRKGEVAGFDLSGMAYDDPVYLSNTAGALGTAAGTVSVVIGRVVPLTNKGLTKVLYLNGIAG
jgi:hypothetical protein